VKALPPPEGADPDLGDGLPEVMHGVIARGEQALRQLRENTVADWISAGAAWKTMQGIAMYRSNSNQPIGRRYAAAYHLLAQPWPELRRQTGRPAGMRSGSLSSRISFEPGLWASRETRVTGGLTLRSFASVSRSATRNHAIGRPLNRAHSRALRGLGLGTSSGSASAAARISKT